MNLLIVLNFLAFALSLSTAEETSTATSVPDICKENNGNFEFLEATYFGKDFIVFGQNNRTFRVSNFKYTDNGFTSDGVEEVQGLDWVSNLRLAFPVEVSKTTQLIVIEYGQIEDISQYVGWHFSHDFKTNKSVNVNLYKYSPEKVDSWNFGELWKNFFQYEIQDRLLSLSPFPFYSDANLPQRYFAYYKELPPDTITDCSGCYEIIRFILMRRLENYTDEVQTASEIQVYNEPSYVIDPTCTPCDNLNGIIVNASSFLSASYEKTAEGEHYFPWIEFFGLNYRILNITLGIHQEVLDEKPIIGEGMVGQIFGCEQPSTTEPGSSSTWLIVGIIFILLIVAIVAIALWMTLVRNPGPTTGQPQAIPLEQSPPSPSKTSKVSKKSKAADKPVSPDQPNS